MLSVKAIYENGKVTLLEEVHRDKPTRAIVTLLDDEQPAERDLDPTLFDDLVGVVAVREDGSVAHDAYLSDHPQ
jgi:hypothetical protein